MNWLTQLTSLHPRARKKLEAKATPSPCADRRGGSHASERDNLARKYRKLRQENAQLKAKVFHLRKAKSKVSPFDWIDTVRLDYLIHQGRCKDRTRLDLEISQYTMRQAMKEGNQ